ncbi:histidine phosphatase superfamily [Crepidotus variabilis]|uniref:Histidine phosphatase superfamily n=1 Tax=Crepidotus variabilis TaxID=179855 RepID=A0A9P6JVZ4_9AGAR|nr:histidine phosphatase superfamily [Crepidotus variabilis]
MATDTSTVVGVVVIARHGDRQGFYQNPKDYTASNTAITALGNVQEFQLGQYIRSLYLNATSSSYIQRIKNDLVDATQVKVRADAGGEGGVIFNSAVSLLQGLYPATSDYNTTLADGTTVTAPLSGYQTIPIESVEPDQDVSLEGWTSCTKFANATSKFYQSDAFKAKAAENKDFFTNLSPYLDGRPVTMENMWNIFDYMNVQSIHNVSFAKALPPTYLEQVRALANFHEYGVFTDQNPSGVGNVAGRTILPSILKGLELMSNNTGPKLVYMAVSYKPIITLFNLTGAASMNQSLAGIPNYASAIAFELRNTSSGEQVVRLNFKNGTNEDLHTYSMFGLSQDVPLSNFTSSLGALGSDDLQSWCNLCGNFKDRGCANLFKPITYITQSGPISKVGAGFLGAGLTLAIALAMLALLTFLGFLSFGKRTHNQKPKRSPSDHGSDLGSTEKTVGY